MMNNKIWKRYLDEKKRITLKPQYAPYGWYTIKNSIDFEWIAFCNFLDEHAPQLSNSINELRRYIKSLSIWKIIIEDLDEQERYNMLTEYINPIATLALNMPYIIRSRFIYSVAHISHQANRLNEKGWKDDLPSDNEIYFDTADKYGKPWNQYKKLKLSLEKIANKKYEKDTHNFRNKYNHRYSPHVEVGLSGFVVRNVEKDDRGHNKVSYSMGYKEPLMLKDIVPLLTNQLELCLESYKKYQNLINEQLLEIDIKGVEVVNE